MNETQAEGKHTPGPWEYKKEFGREGLILTPEGEYIAAFMPDGVGNEQRMEANARLIAAAPALLEALETLVEACSVNGILARGTRAPDYMIAEATKNTIARARGEQVTS